MEPVDKNQDLHPCLIYIDKEGCWFHKGVEMIHREFIRLFYQNMEIDPQGRYIINWNGERCYVEVEDTAFVVRSATCKDTGADLDSRYFLFLSDDSSEELADTLFLGADNVLYCKVKNRIFPARFSRPAYYQLAEYIKEDNGSFYLPCKGNKYNITIPE